MSNTYLPSPAWVQKAALHIGQREVPGPKSNPWIERLWSLLPGGTWFWNTYGKDDSKLPWCGAFVAFVFQSLGFDIAAKFASAQAWATWGVALKGPAVGAVVVFQREGGGHVGFVVGQDQRGRLMVLGGNQGDAVSVVPFDRSRAVAYRWPTGYKLPELTLPIVASSAASSTNEA